jgi:hypothetical protein
VRGKRGIFWSIICRSFAVISLDLPFPLFFAFCGNGLAIAYIKVAA